MMRVGSTVRLTADALEAYGPDYEGREFQVESSEWSDDYGAVLYALAGFPDPVLESETEGVAP